MFLNISYRKLIIIYSSILAWLPFLNIGRFVPGISISELFLIVFTAIALFVKNKQKSRYEVFETIFAFFAFYCCLQTFFIALINNSFEIFWLNRIIRFLFYVICILVTSKKFFDERVVFKSYNVFAVALFIGIIFQYVVYYSTGRYILLYEYILPIDENSLRSLTDYERLFSYGAFRPSSFLLEPSHVAQNLIIVLIYNLFKKSYTDSDKDKKQSFIMILIISLSILLSKSLWGYFLLFLCFGLFFLMNFTKRQKAFWFIFTPVVMLFGFLIVVNSSLFADTFSRINLFDLGGSSSFIGRFGKYEIVDTENLINLFFGNGFGFGISEIRAYPNSILFILVGEGIIGIIILAILYLSTMFKVKTVWKRILCSVFYILLFGSTIFFSTSLVLILSCLFNDDFLKEKTA